MRTLTRTTLEKTMRKLIVAEQISLDGVIQSPGGPKEDPSGDFGLGGWIVPYADALIGQALQDLLSQPFELLLGRRTYEIFAAYWPRKGADSGSHLIADRFNSVPKHVATHRSDALAWQNSHALKGDLADAIRTLKHQDGPNLLTWGSGDMVRQLLAAGLVDEPGGEQLAHHIAATPRQQVGAVLVFERAYRVRKVALQRMTVLPVKRIGSV